MGTVSDLPVDRYYVTTEVTIQYHYKVLASSKDEALELITAYAINKRGTPKVILSGKNTTGKRIVSLTTHELSQSVDQKAPVEIINLDDED
jgi:hypothetical protein